MYRTSTFGLGQLIQTLIIQEIENIIIFVGGSITTDGGLGLLQGLGVPLYNSEDDKISEDCNPLWAFDHWDEEALQKAIKLLQKTHIIVGYDVNCPLYGQKGSAYMFAAQKGATPCQIEVLDQKLKLLENKSQINFQQPGFGAGGGCPAVLKVLGAQLINGFDIINQYWELEKVVLDFDVVVTGEGQMNQQTLEGKLPSRISEICREKGVPVLSLCGQRENKIQELTNLFDGIFVIQQGPCSLKEALRHTEKNLKETAKQIANLIIAITKGENYV